MTADLATRCAAVGRAARGDGDLDEAVAELLKLPAGLPVRGPLAAALINRVLRDSTRPELTWIRHLDPLLEIADQDPPSDPNWPRRRSAARAASMLLAISEFRLADPRAALAELDVMPSDAITATFLSLARMAVRRELARQHGDDAVFFRDAEEVAEVRERLSGLPQAEQFLELFETAYETWSRTELDENPLEALQKLNEAVGRLPDGHPMAAGFADLTVMAEGYARLMADPDTPLDDARMDAMREHAERVGLNNADRAFHMTAAGFAGFAMDSDRERVDAGIEQIRRALRILPDGHPHRAFQLGALAIGLFRRNELGGSLDDMREAAEILQEACDLAGGPHHPQWAMLNEMLSNARRRLPGSEQPGRHALEGLRRHAWKALVQSTPQAARAAVRGAARDALDIARQCLSDGDPAAAMQALDAGRGLTLFAAHQSVGVAERLERAGLTGLARRWRRAVASGDPERLPGEFRSEVWSALSATGAGTGLLDAPSLDEIRTALTTLDADALVYLVPADGYLPGFAVIAPADGPPAYMALPFLRVDKDMDVERYLTTLARRSRGPRGPGDRDLVAAEPEADLGGAVQDMCDWAWRSAIGPLLDRGLPRLVRPRADRVPRLVLVPMGELAQIPWHAARDRDGVFAVRRVAISQAASARMLCHSAGLRPVPAEPLGLIVGDPATGGVAPGLPAARIEAFAVHRAFYRGARYVGRWPDGSPSPSGPGGAEAVRAWLTSDFPAAGATLHLACHGVVDRVGGTAYLVLADGDRLTAGELIALMGGAAGREVGLVVLAACHTGQSIHGYDEAYSLGTAFLAGGARSVLSTQWPVPDGATSLLMYLFHHHLVDGGLPPAQALREAQLWMLDPGRDPELLPGPLRGHLARTDPADVVAWAGFTHWGR